ncbi:MAG TPA: ATP-binding protein, partial [Chitinophagaceae bacterium]|nr:ATP-binding protein [Chitinophagaceae bacterium]
AKVVEKLKDTRPATVASVYFFLGVLNREMGNYATAISQLHYSIWIWNGKTKRSVPESFAAHCHLALLYQKLNQRDSAQWHAQRAYDLSVQSKTFRRFVFLGSSVLGYIHQESGNFQLAKDYTHLSVQQSKMYDNTFWLARNYNQLANIFNMMNDIDSSVHYARSSLQLCQEHDFSEFAFEASSLLAKAFELKNSPDSTVKYMKIMLAAKDSVFSQSKIQEFQKSVFDEEQRKEEIQKKQEQEKNRIKMFALVSGIVLLLLVALILWRNMRIKQRANIRIEKAYSELKATQAQLIQSEKMASLGELTAGIAHEIQNPLNFVNNFSDVNNELVEELRAELTTGNMQLAREIVNDIQENSKKINHHGRRADAIVKGMLQHSRTSSGQKEPTDINALADEYLRLAYHGHRAKDKSFNVTTKTDFDLSLGKINIIPQDIGRVILNLINNAFYAVNEKRKAKGSMIDAESYEPTVTVSTKTENDKVIILVADNGNGIPDSIKGKIFQPFFTTKPTGQGTGLGLSLAYDIIKAHGGELKMNTKEGEGSEFIIQLRTNLKK